MKRRYVIALFLALLLILSLWYFLKALLYTVPLVDEWSKERQMIVEQPKEPGADTKTDLKAIVDKNIFHPDRIYIETSEIDEDITEEPPPPSIMPQLVLKGIVQGPDGEYIAYITRDTGKTQAVRIGDRVENLKVVSISLTDVTIKWNDEDITLSLKKVKTIEKQR